MVLHTRRLKSRHALQTDCIVLSEGGRLLLGDRALDVSWDGLLVRAQGVARRGDRVRASIRLPHSRVWVEGEGYVARVVAGRRELDEGAGYGIRLDRMDGITRLLLTSIFVRYPRRRSSRGTARDYARIIGRLASDPRP